MPRQFRIQTFFWLMLAVAAGLTVVQFFIRLAPWVRLLFSSIAVLAASASIVGTIGVSKQHVLVKSVLVLLSLLLFGAGLMLLVGAGVAEYWDLP